MIPSIYASTTSSGQYFCMCSVGRDFDVQSANPGLFRRHCYHYKKYVKGKKITFIKPPHTQEQQESLAETTPHKIIYSNWDWGQGSYSTLLPSQLWEFSLQSLESWKPSSFKGKSPNSSCRVSYLGADRKAKQNKHRKRSWESAETTWYPSLINSCLF